MAANTGVQAARADIVGSLLRPDALRQIRREGREGRRSAAALREAEDRAVQEAIALQEAIGLHVITDGELRREGWNAPLRAALTGFTPFPGGTGYRWRTGSMANSRVRDDQGRSWPFVTERIQVRYSVAQREYAFLKAHAHSRTKYCLPAPMLTTKDGALEDAATVESRIREAATYVPLERLALSPQCGFASVEAGNPITPAEQEAKLRLVVRIARRVWG